MTFFIHICDFFSLRVFEMSAEICAPSLDLGIKSRRRFSQKANNRRNYAQLGEVHYLQVLLMFALYQEILFD